MEDIRNMEEKTKEELDKVTEQVSSVIFDKLAFLKLPLQKQIKAGGSCWLIIYFSVFIVYNKACEVMGNNCFAVLIAFWTVHL